MLMTIAPWLRPGSQKLVFGTIPPLKKISEGKVRKYLEQNTLLNQMYVKDPGGKTPVKKVLPEGTTVKRFLRYTVGA